MIKGLIIVLIRAYQLFVSPVLPPACRYSPSCSEYMKEAIEKRGVAVGVLKGLGRILRCHPLGGSGYNPVD